MKKILLLSFLISSIFWASPANAQEDNSEECARRTSIYFEYMKAENYKDAYPEWLFIFENCKDLHHMHYIYGTRVLKGLIDSNPSAPEVAKYKELIIKAYDTRLKLYPDERPGWTMGLKASDLVNYQLAPASDVIPLIKKVIELSDARVPNGETIDAAILDMYFNLALKQYDAKKYTIGEMFNIYEEISEILSINQDALTIEYNNLTADSTRVLEQVEVRRVTVLEGLIANNEITSNNIEVRMQPIATCEMLLKVLNEQFAANSKDAEWLRKSSTLLQNKDCLEDPLFLKISEAYYALSPNSRSAQSIAMLAYKRKDYPKAAKFFKEAAEGKSTPAEQARNYFSLAQIYSVMGQKSNSRAAAMSALAIDPKMGQAWLLIAHLYASSANECGNTEFEKRAVHFAAIEMYRKALNSSDLKIVERARQGMASSSASVPDKTMIFQTGMAGKSLRINCWIGTTVTIPSI